MGCGSHGFYRRDASLQCLVITHCVGFFIITSLDGEELKPWMNDNMRGRTTGDEDKAATRATSGDCYWPPARGEVLLQRGS